MWRKLVGTSSAGSVVASFQDAGWRKPLDSFVRDPLVLAVSAFVCLALLAFPDYFLQLLAFYSALLPGMALLLVFILIGRAIWLFPAAPLRPLVQMALHLPARLYLTALFAVMFLAAFTTFKINIPAIVPFYADPWLANADAWLHGVDPWRLARSLPAATSVAVDFLYSKLWFGVAISSILYVSAVGSPTEYRRMIWSTVLIYGLLGVVAASALASVGPVFYDRFYPDAHFRDLIAALDADNYAGGQKMIMNYLYESFRSKTVSAGTGISAMPSIHVGIAVLTAWYLTSRGRAWAIAGWTFALAVLFGSIYTGWHYAVDGYVSGIASTAVWFTLSRLYRLPATALRLHSTAHTIG
jgi:hypothetical protein